jgi:hypothetical protein
MAEEHERKPGSDADVKHDRRRAGRANYTNPTLIRMLRGTFDTEATLESDEAGQSSERPQAPPRDDLAPSRALAVGAGTVFWAVVGLVIWLLVR